MVMTEKNNLAEKGMANKSVSTLNFRSLTKSSIWKTIAYGNNSIFHFSLHSS